MSSALLKLRSGKAISGKRGTSLREGQSGTYCLVKAWCRMVSS